jgi:hypothetical protein
VIGRVALFYLVTSLDPMCQNRPCFNSGTIESSENSEKRMSTRTRSVHPKLKFTSQEDILLEDLVSELGENNWLLVSSRITGRNPRQCKERWMNYLSPDVAPLPWSVADDELLLEKVEECGRRWVQIAEFFPMRKGVHVKNRYLVLQRRQKKELRAIEPISTPKLVFPSLCPFAPPGPLMIPPFATLLPKNQVEILQPLESQRKTMLFEEPANFDFPQRLGISGFVPKSHSLPHK